MKYIIVLFAAVMSVSVVAGQFFGTTYQGFRTFPEFRTSYRLNSINDDFGPSFGGLGGSPSIRDSRADRGPVVFPPPPADQPEESSGVIVGASGYGFVPPNSPSNVQANKFYRK
ncbi:hypothetical protein ACFFRR_006567 [Megaselia abdita]